jgi:ATP-dependent helicase/DNAse subunit B
MPLTLVLGPANSAKAGEVLGTFGAARRRGALLVVPTMRDAEVYSRELAAEGAILGGSVVTFSGLAREIARRVGYTQTIVSELQRLRLLRRALARTELVTLAESAGAPGFAAAALDLIAELERSLISSQRFAQALRAWADGQEPLKLYGREIAAIYGNYVRQLERLGRVDAELYAWRAIDALRADPGRWGATPVFFYGFDDLTPLERDSIETLSRVSGAAVTVSLTYEPGRVALAARAEVVEELRALAERVLELPAVDQYYEHRVLHMLERQLFEAAEDRPDPGQAVRLLESGGERAEVELVAAEVLELLRAGLPPEEIAVVYRSLAGSAALVARVFDEFGIPVAVEREIPFGHTPLGRGVLAMARCSLLPEQEASALELISYLRTPGVLKRIELADRLEATVLRAGLQTAAEARDLCQLRLGELDALRSASAPARELERQARRLLGLPHRGQAALLDRDERLDASAVAVLVRSLAELEELGEAPSGTELVQLLEELMVPVGGRGGAGRGGAVLVAEPLQIRARRFRAVLVCGLQEGSFPAPGAPDPFLSDERRRELNAASGLRLRAREDALARERYLFYSVVSRARERLVLSWRSSDEEGNIELASPFIADVAELLAPEWFERRRRRLLADVVFDPSEAPTERERARAAAAASGSAPLEPAAAAGGSAPREPAATQALSETALSRIRHSEILSAGALEAYADCPVKWLVERELQPGLLGPEPAPIVRGSFIHDLLEKLLSRLERAVTPESLPEAERILDELLRSEESPLAPGRPASVRSAALRSVQADLRRYLAHEARTGSGWIPDALELRFGFDEEPLPALELRDDVRLRGMIDRLDVDGSGGAIVRDYKSGGVRAEYSSARWSEDRQLQVPLYMLAVRELLGLEPLAGFYQPLGGDDLRARGAFQDGARVGSGVVTTDARSRSELDEALEDARSRAVALAARLRAGELTPCPETCSRDGCAYPGICRSS